MIKEYRRYRIEQLIGSVLVNFVINAGLAWLVFRQMPVVPFRGPQSIVGDTIATALLLPLFVALLATPTFRSMLARRVVLLPSSPLRPLPLPQQPLLLGLVLALLATLTLAPATLAVVALAGIESLSFAQFLWFKAGFAALLAALILPLILGRAVQWHLANRY